MTAFGWGVAAAIGSIAGMLVAPSVFLEPNMMIGILIYGFAAALVGGLDNPLGAIVGCILVGISENLLGAYVVGTQLKLSVARSEEHTSELQSLMRISYAVFCLKKKTK